MMDYRNQSLLIFCLLIIDSLHFVFARLLLPHLQPGASALYVMAVGTLQVGLFGALRKEIHLKALLENRIFFFSIGLLIAVSTVINYEAVALIDAGTASMLGKTSILFSICLGLFWLKERLGGIQIFGALTALAGVSVITYQPSDYLRFGSLMVLASAIMYALHAALAKRFGDRMDFIDFFFFRLLCTTGILLLLAMGRREMVWPAASDWILLTMVGTVDVTVSRGLYYLALRRLTVSIHAVVLTLSPVAAVLWSFLLFDALPNRQQFFGGLAVLAGVLIVLIRQPKK
jgi:drug/metabolite transporter (DMT)-like permease